MITVELPMHLRTLAGVSGRVQVELVGDATIEAVLDALELRFPMLRGTIRDHTTRVRRPFLRFFACNEDWSHQRVDALLPEPIRSGREPLLVVGAIVGG